VLQRAGGKHALTRWPLSAGHGTLLGDSTFGGTDLRPPGRPAGRWLLTPAVAREPEPWQHDLYAYRRETIELLFQRIIQACDLKALPHQRFGAHRHLVIASVWLYRAFLDNHRYHALSRTSRPASMKGGGASRPELRADFN
jgi:hypothetical protein